MAALYINIFINNDIRLDVYKNTIIDLIDIFDEIHIKVRGSHSVAGIDFAKQIFGPKLNTYQHLSDSDWVDTTLKIAKNIESKIIFLYCEDHKLVSSREKLKQVIAEFEANNLDFLPYSFFNATRLRINNLLPLNPVEFETLKSIEISQLSKKILENVSEKYYIFSILSIVSKKYFIQTLINESIRYKLHNKIILGLLSRFFPYPNNRLLISKINNFLMKLSIRICMYPKNTPFNLEKLHYEIKLKKEEVIKIGVLKDELYANIDDDNGALNESLIKRGLYPFNKNINSLNLIDENSKKVHTQKISFAESQYFDFTYINASERIYKLSIAEIEIEEGSVAILYGSEKIALTQGSLKHFYTNIGLQVLGIIPGSLKIRLFDY